MEGLNTGFYLTGKNVFNEQLVNNCLKIFKDFSMSIFILILVRCWFIFTDISGS